MHSPRVHGTGCRATVANSHATIPKIVQFALASVLFQMGVCIGLAGHWVRDERILTLRMVVHTRKEIHSRR